MGSVRASNELRKLGVFVSSSGVRSIWLWHGLASMKRRLATLEKSAEEVSYSPKRRCMPWNTRSRSTRLTVKSKRIIRAIPAARTLVPSRTWDVFISRPMWTLTPSGRRPSPTSPRRPSPEPTCSAIEFCLLAQEMGVIRIMADRGTEDYGKLEGHDYKLHPGVNGKGTPRPQRAASTDKWHPRTLLQNHPAGVLPGCLPAKTL